MSRAILFAEVAGFYAAVERADDPRLAGRPVVVGGDPRKRGRVQAVTPDALASGVRVDMPMLEALQLCVSAKAVLTNMARYREVDRRLIATLRGVVARIESFELGSGFADLAGTAVTGEEVALAMRRAVREELSLPLRVGLASGKFLARLAAQQVPEDGSFRIPEGGEDRFLAPLPVTGLEGVGRKTAATLAELGAHTIADVVALGPERLHSALGSHGLRIHALACGRDEEPVRGSRHPKSVSRESRVAGDGIDVAALSEHVTGLVHQLEQELLRNGVAALRVVVKLREASGTVVTRTRTLTAPIASAAALLQEALPLLAQAGMGARPARGLGIQLAELVPAAEGDRQLPLFPGGLIRLKRTYRPAESAGRGAGARMADYSDRRKYQRIATDQVISFAPVDARDLLGVSRNVSLGGIRFEAVGCEIDLGDTLRVTFNVGDKTIVAVGKVAWSTEIDPITMDVGLEFVDIDAQAAEALEAVLADHEVD